MKEVQRCSWCEGDALYTAYHDTEWGVPLFDDEALFEFLLLETFQAGLSWITILRKRQHFHAAFDAFDYRKIAAYTDRKVAALMENPGIIRNRQKIQAALSNALAYAARNERPMVNQGIADLMCNIEKLKSFDKLFDTLEDMKDGFTKNQ